MPQNFPTPIWHFLWHFSVFGADRVLSTISELWEGVVHFPVTSLGMEGGAESQNYFHCLGHGACASAL